MTDSVEQRAAPCAPTTGGRAPFDSPALSRLGWTTTLLALIPAFILQAICLPCLCQVGEVRMKIAAAVDVLVAARAFVGLLIGEKGRGWMFYAILPYAAIPGIWLLVDRFGDGLSDWLIRVLPGWWWRWAA